MIRPGAFGLLGVPLILLLGSLSPTLVWAASLARDPVQVLKSGATVTLYGVAFPSPTAGWVVGGAGTILARSEEHTSELQSLAYLVCRLLLEKKKTQMKNNAR